MPIRGNRTPTGSGSRQFTANVMERRYRLALLCFLLVATFLVCVQFSEPDRWSYPDGETFWKNPGAFEGEQLLLFGEVRNVDYANGTVTVSWFDGRIEGVGLDRSALDAMTEGSSIQLWGTVDENPRRLLVAETVVDIRDGGDWAYLIVTSLAGLVVAVGNFLRYWQIDWRTVSFESRGE